MWQTAIVMGRVRSGHAESGRPQPGNTRHNPAYCLLQLTITQPLVGLVATSSGRLDLPEVAGLARPPTLIVHGSRIRQNSGHQLPPPPPYSSLKSDDFNHAFCVQLPQRAERQPWRTGGDMEQDGPDLTHGNGAWPSGIPPKRVLDRSQGQAATLTAPSRLLPAP